MKQVMRESLLIKASRHHRRPILTEPVLDTGAHAVSATGLYRPLAGDIRLSQHLFHPRPLVVRRDLSSRIVPYEEIIRRVFYVVLCHLGFFVLIQTVWSYGLLPVHLMGTFYIVLTVLLMLWRYICRIVVNVTRGHGRNARRVIIVGSKDNAVEVYHEMVDNTSTGLPRARLFQQPQRPHPAGQHPPAWVAWTRRCRGWRHTQ